MRNAMWIGAALFGGCGTDEPRLGDPGPTSSSRPDLDWDNDGYDAPDDCDDTDADIHPHQIETCNGLDDDCDGGVDVNAVGGMVGFADADGDGFGDVSVPVVSCVIPGWSPVSGDCADLDATRFPGAVDVCNALDDDCDTLVDEGAYLGAVRFDTIQEAVSNATDGDTVEICAALHPEGGISIDRDITVKSTSGVADLTVINGSLVTGSVFVVDGGALTLEGVTVTGGTGTETEVADVFFPFTATAGGAVNALLGEGGAITIRKCVFDHNSAAAGGAIAARTLVVTDSTFSDNTAEEPEPAAGGALWVGPGGLLTVENTVFRGNVAQFGGALVAYSPTTLVAVEAMENFAHTNGGFGQIQSATVEGPAVPNTLDVIASQFHDNTAVESAGVLEMLRSSGSADAATTFDANVAANTHGGAIVMETFATSITWEGGVFTNNFAEDYGGAFHIDPWDGTIMVSGVVVADNTAAERGGGISAFTLEGDFHGVGPGTFVLRDSVLTGNETLDHNGGGVYVEGNFFDDANAGPLGRIERVQLVGNVAAGRGAGVGFGQSAHVEIMDCLFQDNVAVSGGGAITVLDSIVDVTSADFSLNQPDDVLAYTFFDGEVVFTPAPSDATFTCDSANGEPYCL